MKNDDIALIQRILAGDAIAFERLVGKYQKQVHTLAWRKVRDFHIAEDITQETFLQVYQKLETLEDPTRFPGWLYVIADRLCIAWLRRNQRQTEPLEDTDISEVETEAYSQYIATEHAKTFADARRDLVEELLAKLKEGNRTVITLHYLEGMTYAEISNFLGVSENTIKSRLRRARQQLKKYEFMVPEALDITIEAEHRSQRHLGGGFGMKLTFERDELLYPLQMLRGSRVSRIPHLCRRMFSFVRRGTRLNAWRQTWKSASEGRWKGQSGRRGQSLSPPKNWAISLKGGPLRNR